MRIISQVLMIAFLGIFIGQVKADENSNGVKSSAVSLNYKTLEPLIIPIIKSGKVYGYLRLEVQLATKDGSPVDAIKPIYPILRDRYYTNLYSLLCDRWLPDTPLNQDVILKLIRNITTAVVVEQTKEDNITAFLKGFYFTPTNK